MPAKKSDQLELVDKLNSLSECPSVILVLGPDSIRRERFIDLILEKFLGTGTSKLGGCDALTKISAAELKANQIPKLLLEISSPSLFSKTQFFLIEEVDDADAPVFKALTSLAAKIPKGVRLFLSGKKLGESNPLQKAVKAAGLVFIIEELKGYEFKRWLKRELNQVGISEIEPEAIDFIAELSEGRADEAARVVSHASLYCEQSQLTLADLRKVFAHAAETNEFSLIDAITGGNLANAQLLVHSLIKEGKNSLMLLGMLARAFGNYTLIKDQERKGRSGAAVRESLGMTPWVFNKHALAAKHYSLLRLKECQEEILSADGKLKGRALGAELVLSDLVANLTP